MGTNPVEFETHGGAPRTGDEAVRNVHIKNVVGKKIGEVGDIAHYHVQEDEHKTWEEACYFVDHLVNDPAGFRINDFRYRGRLVVPQCLAGQLAHMETHKAQAEMGLFKNQGKTKFVREFR